MDKLALSVKETAQALGISESAVYWMIYRNELPHTRTSARGRKKRGKILIPVKVIEQWLMGEEVKI